MDNKKSDPILLASAVIALIATVYVLYITVFEQIINQNQGYFYAVVFGFILLVLFLLCNLFTKLIAISVGEQHSSYRKLVVAIGLVVIAGLFLVTRMRYNTALSPGGFPVYNSAVAMSEGTYSQSHDLVEEANTNPGHYLYSLILSVVFRIAGQGTRQFLWVNAFFIILCGYLTYRIVKKFTNAMCGLFAAALCAFIPSQTFAVYSFSSEPMVAAIFLGAIYTLISLVSYDKHVKEFGEEKASHGGLVHTIVGCIVIGLLIFVEPLMIIPIALVVLFAAITHNTKSLNMLVAFAAGIVLLVILCFARSAHMGVDFGTVMTSEISAFDPVTNRNTTEVSEISDVFHRFNADLSSTDSNIVDNYMFISDSSNSGVYTEMSSSWVIVLNQIMYMFVLMMTISCVILAVKEQKDYVVSISMLIVGAVIMLFFQQNRESQKFLFITVFIIASATGIHYLYLDHHPELKVGINALDALEKTGRKEMAAATRTNLINAAQMTEADFVKRAKALIFVGNDEELYRRIKAEEYKGASKYAERKNPDQQDFDDYDEDFFLDKEDDAALDVTVTTVAPSGIRQTVAADAYEPNAEMHESANAAYSNTSVPAWKRPEKFGDEEMFDEDELELDKEHSAFEGRDSLIASAGLTTNEPAPAVEKIRRNTKKVAVAATPVKKKEAVREDVPSADTEDSGYEELDGIKEPAPEEKKKGRKERVKKEKVKKEKPAKSFAHSATSESEGRAVRRIKTVGGGAAVTQTVSSARKKVQPAEPAPSEPIPNPLPVPKKKEHKPVDYDRDVKPKKDDDWDFDYDGGSDDDWDY